MTDTFTKQERSSIMRRGRGRGNASTELKVVGLFRAHKITGWRRHLPLIGKPDFTFPKQRAILFIDGCFWHGHNCRNFSPSQNSEYWQGKIARNMAREVKVKAELEGKGWRVLRVWECELKDSARFIRRVSELILSQCVSSI